MKQSCRFCSEATISFIFRLTIMNTGVQAALVGKPQSSVEETARAPKKLSKC